MNSLPKFLTPGIHTPVDTGAHSKDLLPTRTFQQHQILVDRYEILSRLGEGGMSEVWHAFDLKLRVDVALKALRHDRSLGGQSTEAVRHEVRSAREVISPNVCRIFDLVVEKDQELISMEYIDGITLMAMLIKKGPLEASEARDIAAQFLAGLEAIHNAGLVHCDLKPENIMITQAGRVVVMDFGISKHKSQIETLISGTLSYMSPEQLSGAALDARTDIFSAGVVLAEMIHPQGILTEQTRHDIWNAVHQDPRELPDSIWKSAITRAVSKNCEDRFLSAGELSRALEESMHYMQTSDESPYPGLSSFTSGNSRFFFGRELEVEMVLKKLHQLHMIALIGASGAGKTSFLRAGLIPSLPADWSCLFCVPGDSPEVNLGHALAPQLSKSTDAMQKMLQFGDPAVAVQFLDQWRKKHNEAVLIVDRFEELFTLNPPEVQIRFAEMLMRAALEADVHVLLCMRDDFLMRCHDSSALDPFFSGLIPLGALSGPALRRALIQPALECGYRYQDDRLVDQILSDVESERGALPLMAFAAARLWAKRDRQSGELTEAAYRQIGGVAGALAQHAEETIDRIGTERQQIVRELFRNLVTAENTRATRDTKELLTVFPEMRAAEEVLRALIDARLLTSFEEPAEEGKMPRSRVEIIHESLLSAWPRLIRWQTQDADSAQLRDQLRQAAQLWDQKDRTEDLLWTGAAFLDFQAWRLRYPGGLTSNEEAFADAMQRQANKTRRKRRMALATMFVVLLSVVAVLSSFWRKATVARDDAVSQTRRAESSKVLTLGRAAPQEAKLAYALTALESFDSPEGRRFALQSLSGGPPLLVMPLKRPIEAMNFSPDGKWIAASGELGAELISQDGTSSQILSNKRPTRMPRFSPEGEFVLWLDDPKTVQVWSLSHRKIIRTFVLEGEPSIQMKHSKVYFFISTTAETPWKSKKVIIRTWNYRDLTTSEWTNWSKEGIAEFLIAPDERSILYRKGQSFFVRSLEASGMGPEKLVEKVKTEIERITYHSNGHEIATSDSKGIIRLWSFDPGIRNPIRVISGNGINLDDLWFDDAGSFIAARQGKDTFIWDLKAPLDAEPMVVHDLREFTKDWRFDSESRWIVSASSSALAFYPLTHKYPFTFHGTGWGSFNVRFTPDGKSLVDGFSDDGIRFFGMPGEKQTTSQTFWPPVGNTQPIDVDPSGKNVLLGTNAEREEAGIHVLSIANGNFVSLKRCLPGRTYDGAAFSTDGRFVAAVGELEPSKNHGIEIWDLQSGKCRALEQSKGIPSYTVRFSPDGSLYSGDLQGNLYRWNLKDDSRQLLGTGKGMISSIAITKDGRRLAAVTLSVKQWGEIPVATSELALYDLQEKKSVLISSHGNRVFSVTFDHSGTKLVTGDIDGVVRAGPITGDTPNLLMGHESTVSDVAVHPNGKWIASTEIFKAEMRLWPMPEDKPFYDLSYKELLNRLRALTNVRIIPDTNSSTGYKIKYDRFPGWEKVPVW